MKDNKNSETMVVVYHDEYGGLDVMKVGRKPKPTSLGPSEVFVEMADKLLPKPPV